VNKAFGLGVGGVVLLSIVRGQAAMAACSNTAPSSNTTVTCSGAGVPTVTAQTGSTGVAINVDPTATGSFSHSTNATVFSVDSSSTITSSGNLSLTGGGGSGTARGAVLLGINNNQITNAAAGIINTTGAFNDGMAANGSGNTLTNQGSITTSGPNAYGMTAAWGQTNSGQLNNTLINTGSVSTSGSNARAASILGGSGTINNSGTLSTTGASSTTAYMQGNNDQLINSGSISARGTASDAVFSNTAGSSFTATIQNLAGGQIISQSAAGIRTLNGNSTVINAGLVQSNVGLAISMGSGNDSLILQTGSVINGGADGGAGTNSVTLQGTGTASNAFTNFQTLLMQGTLWNWTGSGTFALAHVQTGALNLVSTLGSTTMALVDSGATLQATAQTLPLSVTDNGLVRFAQDNAGTYGGLISGGGALTKAGTGSLLMTGVSTYSGATMVEAGTLAIGDPAHANAALAGGGNIAVAAGTTLGGYGSVNGAVTNNGTLAVANALPAFANATNASFTINGSLVNAGLVQIGGQGVGNQLLVNGNYTGQSGTVGMNTYVAGDGAASDRLVISGGSATGSTRLKITNVGGPGAQTVVNGIQVIQASNGATTAASAFTLAAPVEAGAYAYYLAKGGVTAGTSDNWYLRNTVAPLPATVPDTRPGSPVSFEPGVPVAAAGTAPLPAPTGSEPVPLYRPEVPLYAEIPGVARQLGMLQVDTFHDRQGDQSLLGGDGTLPASWGRAWGGHSVLSQEGAVNPEFDGSIYGVQTGQDIHADTSASGQQNRYGLFVGFARATGNVDGFALGMPNLEVGHLAIDTYSLGAYWTHIGPGGWYTDTVLMGSSLTVDAESNAGLGTTMHGDAVTGSVEGGLPTPLGAGLTIEPQAQLIWQHLSINDLNDGISTVTFNSGNTFLGRLGVRLQAHLDSLGTNWQPYLRLNVLRSFGAADSTTFGGATEIGTSAGQTTGQIGAGVTAKVSQSASVYATASWLSNLGGAHQRTVLGNAGVRWVW
jgi:outer membrane autotransporter protein